MDFLGLLTIATVALVTVGDPVFVHIIRARVPLAYSAAGSPSPPWIAMLTPFYFGPYVSYVLKRKFREHLAPRGKLYTMANALFLTHLVLTLLSLFWFGLFVWFVVR